jgi:hypothetical protein
MASLVFVAVGLWMIGQVAWVGWLSIAFGGVGALASLLELIAPSSLLLDADGFTSWKPLRPRRTHLWTSCSDFEVALVSKRQSLVAYSLDRHTKYLSAGYGSLSASQLAALMNAYRVRAR